MICYTDGACSGNGYEGAYGGFGVVVLTDEEELITTYSKGCVGTTNNREEIKAVLWTLLTYGNLNPVVYSDSAYVVNTFNSWVWKWRKNGWLKSDNKTPENLDLIKAFCEYWDKGYRITLRKCDGHKGVKYNEMADKLAVAAKEEMKIGK